MEFIRFLRERYTDDAALTKAWGGKDLTFDDVRFPSRKNKAFTQANDVKKQDITEFWALPIAEQLVEEEEEDENE